MTSDERVFEALSATGVPGALQAYPEGKAPPAPFFVYMLDTAGEFYADDSNWAAIPSYRVELYEKARDADLEERFASAIRSAFGPVSVMEDWVESEHARMVTFRFACA